MAEFHPFVLRDKKREMQELLTGLGAREIALEHTSRRGTLRFKGSESKRKQKAQGSYIEEDKDVELRLEQPTIPLAVDQGKGRWYHVEPTWQACTALRRRTVESKECRVPLTIASDYDVTPDLAAALQKCEVHLGEGAGAEFVRFEAVTREYRVRFFTLKHYQKANKEAVRAWAPEDVAAFLRAADLDQHLDLFQGKGGAELVHMTDHQLSKIYRLKQEPAVRAQLLDALQRIMDSVECRHPALAAAGDHSGPLCAPCRKRLGVASPAPAPRSPRPADVSTASNLKNAKRAYDSVDSDDDNDDVGGAGYVDVRAMDKLRPPPAATQPNYVEAPPAGPAAATKRNAKKAAGAAKKRNKSEAAVNAKGNGNRGGAAPDTDDDDEEDAEAMERMKVRARAVARENGYVFREIDYRELDLEQKIGAGSFGEVYKATWRGAPVAAKKIINMDDDDDEMVDEFMREAAMMDLLGNHPNIVKFVGACLGPFCLVSAFCANGSLEDLLQKDHDLRLLSNRTLVRMAMDIGAGILHLHREGVIHRDIAARNVLVGEDFTVYVTDFGFARIKEKGGDGGNTQSTLGPVRHMSPESLKERRYSEKSDVYSFGVLLYEMWMREAPYMGTGMDLLQIALRVMNEGLRPPVPPNAPPALQALLERCWKADPTERPDLAGVLVALKDLYCEL